MSSTVDVHYDSHTWKVDIANSLCEARQLSHIVAKVFAAAPASARLPARTQLQGRTSGGDKWTTRNITELPNQRYIQLLAAGGCTAAPRDVHAMACSWSNLSGVSWCRTARICVPATAKVLVACIWGAHSPVCSAWYVTFSNVDLVCYSLKSLCTTHASSSRPPFSLSSLDRFDCH